MPASPKKSLQRERSKWGFSMASVSCLALGLLAFLVLMLFNMPFIPALAIGLGIGAALGLTFGRSPEKIFKALHKPQRRIRGFLSNDQLQRFPRKD
jgi:hypothetical protein